MYSVRGGFIESFLLFGGAGSGARGVDPTALDDEPLVRAFELGPHLDKKATDLSSGLRKRAGLVAGMLFDPHVILLDEPTNSIDPITRDLFIDYVNQLHVAGRTVLTVTHDLEYCWKAAERVVVLDDRHVVEDVMLADVPDYGTFTDIATLGRGHADVDFGLQRTGGETSERRG